MSQNVFKLFDTPGTAAVKHLKSQVFAKVLRAIRTNGWKSDYLQENLGFTAEETEMFNDADLHDIPLEKLVHALGTIGYDVDARMVPNV